MTCISGVPMILTLTYWVPLGLKPRTICVITAVDSWTVDHFSTSLSTNSSASCPALSVFIRYRQVILCTWALFGNSKFITADGKAVADQVSTLLVAVLMDKSIAVCKCSRTSQINDFFAICLCRCCWQTQSLILPPYSRRSHAFFPLPLQTVATFDDGFGSVLKLANILLHWSTGEHALTPDVLK